MYTKESLEKLREEINLFDVITDSMGYFCKKYNIDETLLKTFWKCPFCEDGELFIVDNYENSYHCYECHTHGDAVSFLMLHEELSFIGVVEKLADMFNVDIEEIPDKEAKPYTPHRDLVKEILSRVSLTSRESLWLLKKLKD